ncbi:hypothetical protein [Staphylococcus capitis]
MIINKEFTMDYLTISKNIRNYKMREFEDKLNIQDGIFDLNFRCPLAYTTIGENEQIEIQVTLDIENMRIIREVKMNLNDGKQYKQVQTEAFQDMKDVIHFTSHLRFDELVDVDEEYYEHLYKSKNH